VEGFKSPIVKTVRGKGLLNAVVIDESQAGGRTAWDLCLLLKEKGVLVSTFVTLGCMLEGMEEIC
jgi:ornithine--oxo-acid transaminase